MQGYIKRFSLNNLNINDITNFILFEGGQIVECQQVKWKCKIVFLHFHLINS